MSARVMLTEDQVNGAVKAFLEARGWVNVIALDGRRHGIDVEGYHPSASSKVQVESKGGTSGDPATRRFGRPCSPPQIKSHVAKAVFAAICLRERSQANTVLIALPDDLAHIRLIERAMTTLKTLDIGLIGVSTSGVRVIYGTVDPDRHPASLEPNGA